MHIVTQYFLSMKQLLASGGDQVMTFHWQGHENASNAHLIVFIIGVPTLFWGLKIVSVAEQSANWEISMGEMKI